MHSATIRLLVFITIISATGCGPKWSESQSGDKMIVNNDGGKTLGYSPQSGVKILTVDRFAFKDLNQNGTLDSYEDWRLDAQQRAEDLASQMNIENSRTYAI